MKMNRCLFVLLLSISMSSLSFAKNSEAYMQLLQNLSSSLEEKAKQADQKRAEEKKLQEDRDKYKQQVMQYAANDPDTNPWASTNKK